MATIIFKYISEFTDKDKLATGALLPASVEYSVEIPSENILTASST